MSEKSTIEKEDFWFAGEDKELQFTIRDENQVVIDVTGWSFQWELCVNGAVVLTKVSPGGVQLTDPTNGIVTVIIADTDTASIVEGNHKHVLKRIDSGDAAVLAHGQAYLNVSC